MDTQSIEPPTEAVSSRQEALNEPNLCKRFLKILGPGLITGASDDDPSGIGTYSIAGASLGYSMLWLSVFTLPMLAAVQYSCAKIGMVTGQGLAGVLRRHYPRPLLFCAVAALFIANTLNVGADIGAIAAAINLLVKVPALPTIIATGVVILLIQIFAPYKVIAQVFKWLTIVLFAYIATAFLVHADMAKAMHDTFVPTIKPTKEYISTLVAILGTTISPYLFFWQASQEVEEDKAHGKKTIIERQGATKAELKVAALDVNVGMFLSNLVMYFIIFTCAATLFATGHKNIQTATDAALALRPLAGQWSEILLAIGLIGTGCLAVPILTGSAGYALSEAFVWRGGLDDKPSRAKKFYGVIAFSTLLGIGMNFVGMNAMSALFWCAVINGLVAPPLLVLIMLISNNKEIMGERVNGRLTNVLGWITTIAMFAAAIGLLCTWNS